MLKPEWKLHINNKEKNEIISFFLRQIMKIKHYKKIIDRLLSLIFRKSDKFLLSIKKIGKWVKLKINICITVMSQSLTINQK